MVKIGLISDTHSYVDKNINKFFKDVDEIWHAGDLGSFDVYEYLVDIAKVRAVYGNIDGNNLRQELPLIQNFKIENVAVFMTHIGGYPKNYAPNIKKELMANKTRLFISGHSHILRVVLDKQLNCLHMNPGAFGIHGFHKFRTLIRFAINASNIQDLEIWEYPRSKD